MATIDEAFQTALQYHRAGEFQQAEQLYWQILQVVPGHAEVFYLLGMLAHQNGRDDLAVAHLERAIALDSSQPQFHNDLGELYRRQGRLAEAAACFQRALGLRPDDAEAHYNRGNTLAASGNMDEAIACFRRAVQSKPDYPQAQNNLGNALASQGRLDEAIVCWRQALQSNPDLADAHHNLGSALAGRGDLEEAIACYRRAIELRPDDANVHNSLGNALLSGKQLDKAIASYRRAVELAPGHAHAHHNMGVAWNLLGDQDAAIACYHRAIELRPDYAEAYNSLALARREQGKLAEATDCCREALRRKPDYAGACNTLALALEEQGKLDEAVDCCQRALERNPDYAEAWYNLGNARGEQGKLDEAMACYERALRLKPGYVDARWNRCLLWLLRGDFQRGWPDYELRFATNQSPPRMLAEPEWDGGPLQGRTILLHAEQGLGDTIQFIRYAELVQGREGTVFVECQDSLAPLLAGCRGIDRLISRGSPLPPFDVQAPLLSLPRILRTGLETIPARVPYLAADAALVDRWAERLRSIPGFRVGIAWQGNPRVRLDRLRSIPLVEFAPLAEAPGVSLISLQRGFGAEQLTALGGRFPVRDPGEFDEYSAMDRAAILMNLDLMITSDTAMAHLAGALGVPVWVALPFMPDWRWLLDRDDSPWYPSMRLFRQTAPSDWAGVFQRIKAELVQRVCEPRQWSVP